MLVLSAWVRGCVHPTVSPQAAISLVGGSWEGHAVTHASDTCLPSTGANPHMYGGVMLGWVGGGVAGSAMTD